MDLKTQKLGKGWSGCSLDTDDEKFNGIFLQFFSFFCLFLLRNDITPKNEHAGRAGGWKLFQKSLRNKQERIRES